MKAGSRHSIATITTTIVAMDAHINSTMNAVLHHPLFQKLEAVWRNLYFLMSYAPAGSNIKIKILTLAFAEMHRDVTYAIEFDQSELFNKIYSEEFGMPGGEPFGLLLGDYEIRLRQLPHAATAHDIDTLRAFSEIAAAAFVPFIVNVDVHSFGIDTMNEFEKINDLDTFFKLPEFSYWNEFRHSPQACFIGLTFPKTILRKPYDKHYRKAGFIFHEQQKDAQDYLWGNANFSFAATVLTAFKEQGWFNALRGSPFTENSRGAITHLPAFSFDTDAPGFAPRHGTQTYITDHQEKVLSDAGFIPLCTVHHTKTPIFYSDRSIQTPQHQSTQANISILLQYLLCACRFAHYLKIIGRNKMGSFLNANDCENYLNQWILDYTVANDDLSWEQQAKYPLKKANITVNPVTGMPGRFHCLMHIEPHFYIEQLESTFLLVTELSPDLGK